ncbi:MAG: cytochrome P450 [Pseudomonadota bacterium]
MSVASPTSRRAPGPCEPLPLAVNNATLSVLQTLAGEYGDVVRIPQANERVAYFINDADAVREILVRQHQRYRKGRGFERVKMLLGNGLIVSDGEVWRRSRTMVQPAFKPRKLHRLTDHMVACARSLQRQWRTACDVGESLNITRQTSDFALELILISIFGEDLKDVAALADDERFQFLAPEAGRDLEMVKRVRDLRRWIQSVIDMRRTSNRDDDDFLALYLAATDRTGQPFTDKQLLDEMITLIVAGFETSANTLNWFWYLISAAPEIESALLEEIKAALALAGGLNADTATNMPLAQAVLEETLRLYPPVWLFSRQALEPIEVAGYDIEQGADLYLSPYLLHRHADHWRDPEAFSPDRFLDRDAPPKAFFPFSLGPRRCIGEYFSFLEMKLHMAVLLPEFQLARIEPAPPACEFAINLRARDDIRLMPTRRGRAA